MARKTKRYGWVRDLPDQRDHLYAAPMEILRALPPEVDLRGQCPPVYDQGDLGSCTANAVAAAVEFDRKRQDLRDFMPSRLFIYYNVRVLEGTVDSDSGAQIRDAIKTVATFGDCPEEEWPYDVSKFADKPVNACYLDAAKVKAVQYSSIVQSQNQMKACLASGFPFVFGFSVYESFESPAVADSGVVQIPGPSEALIGGHAVVAVGYDDSEQRFIVRNSWSIGWGMRGYFTMPYAYLTDPMLSSDFWTIRLITG